MNNKAKEILLKKRYRAEKRFRFFGLSSIILALSFLCVLLVNIFTNGLSAFSRTEILLNVNFNEKKIISSLKKIKSRERTSKPNLLRDPLLVPMSVPC